jgi:hypothetical protein
MIKPFPVVMGPGTPTIHGFSAQVIVTCSCGGSGPMLLPFVMRADVAITCPKCKTSYRMGEISWKQGMVIPDIKLQGSQPNVVIANAITKE